MLAELSIKNFAIIEELTLNFDDGLTVFTGETGAGKSIIIDAINLLSGGRGSVEFVRYGEKKAELEGLFFVDEVHPVLSILEEYGIVSDEGEIILQREISHTGKSICRINNKLVTLTILRHIGGMIVDIHGQHEHQSLMQTENHIILLDDYGKDKVKPYLSVYKKLYSKYMQLEEKQKQLANDEQQMAHRLDLIQYQAKEIEEANLLPDEEEELNQEKVTLSNYERLYESIGSAYKALSEDNRGLYWVANAMNELEGVSELEAELKASQEAVTNCFYVLEDVSSQLRAKWDSLEFNPERLDYIEERLNAINQLKRKYGSTVKEILTYAEKIKNEIDTIQNRELHLEEIDKQMTKTEHDLLQAGNKLSQARKEIADELAKLIQKELESLYMDKTKFKIQFTKTEPQFLKNGIDEIEFYISTNPGEPLKPLTRTASGGELSRIMLALKTIFSNQEGITSIIFDEVDTGVSGRVAQAMAEKIQKLSLTSQVFCITHLPQVAAISDNHLYISKKTTSNNRTITDVRLLNDEEKIKEVARMLSGAKMTALTKQHAEELIELATKIKHHS